MSEETQLLTRLVKLQEIQIRALHQVRNNTKSLNSEFNHTVTRDSLYTRFLNWVKLK